MGLLFSRLNSTSLFLLCSNSHQQHTSYCELGVVSRGLRISTATRAKDSHHSSKEEERTAQRLRGVPVATGLAGSWGQDPHFVHLKSLLFSTTTNFLTKISTSKGMIIKCCRMCSALSEALLAVTGVERREHHDISPRKSVCVCGGGNFTWLYKIKCFRLSRKIRSTGERRQRGACDKVDSRQSRHVDLKPVEGLFKRFRAALGSSVGSEEVRTGKLGSGQRSIK